MRAMEKFPETSWSLLARTSQQGDTGVRAKQEFAQRYYRPVEAFLAALVKDNDWAQDLAHEFFVRIMDGGGLLNHADKQRSFREYLKQVLRNLVKDDYRRNRRASNQAHPDRTAGGWDTVGAAALPAAEAAFHEAWVRLTLAEALARVRALCLKRSQEVHLYLFEARYLGEADVTPSWAELGKNFGLDQKSARERADTVGRHFRITLRRMLRNEVAVPGDGARSTSQAIEEAVDREIKALLAPLED